uniref:ZM domain-containing protein n=1 Tax=Angiostrongylus cantonensis TaxID=6313 RepID=A0A0K0D4E0_ANGCA
MTPEQVRAMGAKADEERRRLKNNALQPLQNTSVPQPHIQSVQHQPPSILHKVTSDGTALVPEKIYRNHADAPIRKLTCDLIKTYKNINELPGAGPTAQAHGNAPRHSANLEVQQSSSSKGLPHFDTNAPPASQMVVPAVPEIEAGRNRQKSSRGGLHNGGYDDENYDYILKDGECFNTR